MLGRGGAVASGGIAAVSGGSASPIPLSTTGAQVGDLIMLVSPHGAATPGGAGWTTITYDYGYTGSWSWKVLDNLADISVTGPNYSMFWGIYRGPKTAVRVIGYADPNPPFNVSWPGPGVGTVAQVYMLHAQGAFSWICGGFTKRTTASPGIFSQEIHDRFGSPIGIASVAGGGAYINGIELRS